MKTVPKTSPMAPLPPGLQYDIPCPSWYTHGPHRCLISSGQCGYHPEQHRHPPSPLRCIWTTRTINVALADKIKDFFFSNPLVLQAVHQMEKELPLFNRPRADDWTFNNGQLYYKAWLYVPKSAHHNLVAAAHSSFEGSHGSHLCTITLLSKDYWWPGLSTYIQKYISVCTVCQAHKVLTHPTVPAITPLAFKGSCPFQNLSMDLITDLLPVNGLDFVMVVVNRGLSKGVTLAPCTKTMDTTGIANFFSTMSLNNSDYMKKLCQTVDPICLSLRQRTHKTPTIQYGSLLSLSPTNQWKNRTLQPRTRNLPLHLLWRTTPEMARTPSHGQICLQCSHTLGHQQISILPNYEIWTMSLPIPQKDLPSSSQASTQSNWGYTKGSWSCHKSAQQHMREWTFSHFKPWKVGDKVWPETRNLKLQVPSRKLSAKWTGLFEITQVVSSIAFQLKLPKQWKIHNMFHASLLSSYRETPGQGPNFP